MNGQLTTHPDNKNPYTRSRSPQINRVQPGWSIYPSAVAAALTTQARSALVARLARLGSVEPILDHVREPFGLLNDLLQAGTDGARQGRLGQRRPREREHTRDRLAHIVTCFSQPLSGIRMVLGVRSWFFGPSPASADPRT
jgi:hypothetical protein